MTQPYSLLTHGQNLIVEIERFSAWYLAWEKDAVVASIVLNLLSQLLSLLNRSKIQGQFIKSQQETALLLLFCEIKESLHHGLVSSEDLPASVLSLCETLFKNNPHATLAWVLINLEENACNEELDEIRRLMTQISPALSEARAQVICANVDKLSKQPLACSSLKDALKDATQGWLIDK